MASVACLGMAVWDRIFSVPALPKGPIKLYASRFVETGGGPAATASVAIARLGGSPRLIGRVGNDTVGQLVIDELVHEGVNVSGLVRLEGARSAWSSVSVDTQGERLILNFPGEGLNVEPAWINETLLRGCGALLIDMGWRRGAMAAIRIARSLNIPVVLDADFSPDPETRELIANADHVLFSQASLRQMTKTDDMPLALRQAVSLAANAQVIGVTVGGEGCLLLENDTLTAVQGLKVDVVDTLGAGDVFHGAYALAIAENASVAAAARFANAAAALKCTRHGGRAGSPVRHEVEAALGR
ncbi:PfkB family carbohydrate kinase [Shinella zoogloeoides]|uniref:PfkB family carbohydrate kinase n=1 Tax=Shinella zoogloeoides TaxID=352475 RepID=UPI0013C378AE|nr:PfkB family carbohydrate kinase [Shinella zoogloeoides]